jgi:putative transposase
MHLLPGTTFRNTVVKASYVPGARAVLTVRELERWVCQQIVIKNHQEHRSLQGWSPEITWVNYWANHQDHARAHYVNDIQHFYLTFLHRHSAILQSNGIKWATYQYYDPCLEAFPIGKKIEFAVDPSNIRRIWVYDPMGARHHSVAIRDEPLSDELTIDAALRSARRLESRSPEKLIGLRELERKATEIVDNAKREKHRATAQRQGSPPVVLEALQGLTQVNSAEKPTQSVVTDFDLEAEGEYVPQLRMPNVREL